MTQHGENVQVFSSNNTTFSRGHSIGEKATKEATAAVQRLVTGKGKDITAGGKGKRKFNALK